MGQYIIQKPPPGILKSKAPPHGKEKLAKAQGCQVMLGGYQLVWYLHYFCLFHLKKSSSISLYCCCDTTDNHYCITHCFWRIFFMNLCEKYVNQFWLSLQLSFVTKALCRYQFDRLPSPPGTPGLLHQNVCPAPGILHNRKCPGARPINDVVPGAGNLHQQTLKHENC